MYITRVYIIEDCYDSAKLLSSALSHIENREVRIFTDPLEALKSIKDSKFSIDLIICDLLMPKIDGHEFYDELRAIGNYSKFIVLSNENLRNDIEEFTTKGANAYLLKKQGLDIVINKIEEIINDHENKKYDKAEVFEIAEVIDISKIKRLKNGLFKLRVNNEISKGAILNTLKNGDNTYLEVEECSVIEDVITITCKKVI